MAGTTDPRPDPSPTDGGGPSEGAAGLPAALGFEVVQDEDVRAYLAVEDGEVLGAVTYEAAGDRIVLRATTVSPQHQGRGVATRLGIAVLDRMRSEGRSVLVTCPFMRRLVDRNPEYADLEAPGPRDV